MVHGYAKTIFPEAEFIPAKDGAQALELYLQHMKEGNTIGMIFMDYLMPDMDGIYAAEKILEIDADAFIVMVTSNLQEPIRKKAEEAGIRAFFNKPIKKSQLEEIKQLWDSTTT